MRTGVRGGAAVVLGMLLLGCPRGMLDGEGDPASSASAQAPGAPGPTVTIDGSQVLLDGEIADSTRAVEELGRLQKLDKLFEELKKKREATKAKGGDAPLEGRASLAIEQEVNALVFKSVFQTAAYAGFSHIAVKTPGGFVTVEAKIPGPPSDEPELTPVAMHLHVSPEELTVVTKLGVSVMSERKLPRPADGFDALVKEAIVSGFLRQEVRPEPTPLVVLHFDNQTTSNSMIEVFDAAAAAHRRLAGPDGSSRAFRLEMSMR